MSLEWGEEAANSGCPGASGRDTRGPGLQWKNFNQEGPGQGQSGDAAADMIGGLQAK
jgi:hypothetical protein